MFQLIIDAAYDVQMYKSEIHVSRFNGSVSDMKCISDIVWEHWPDTPE